MRPPPRLLRACGPCGRAFLRRYPQQVYCDACMDRLGSARMIKNRRYAARHRHLAHAGGSHRVRDNLPTYAW